MAEQFRLDRNYTLTVSHFVKQGAEQSFEATLRQVILQAKSFKGYMGIQIFQPADQVQNEYLLLVRFDTEEYYKQWEDSDIRKEWSAKLKPYTYRDPTIRHQEGLEFWFSSSHSSNPIPPIKWKMALLTWFVIYPLILLLSSVTGMYLSFIHPFLRMLLVSMVLVVGMTYIIMPSLTKQFSSWIFKE